MSGVLRLSLLALVFGAVFILDSVNPAPLDYEARGKQLLLLFSLKDSRN